jgi:hypothetical protein
MADLPRLPELRFAEIPATSRHRYVGDRFCYMEAGQVELPPVLLLHGIGANSLHWRFQLAGLADRFRLIAWNAPGYLLSDNLRAERRAAMIMPMRLMTCWRRSGSIGSTLSPTRSARVSRSASPITGPDGLGVPCSPAPVSLAPCRRRSAPGASRLVPA